MLQKKTLATKSPLPAVDETLYQNGIHYFTGDFNVNSTKPVIEWIIASNLVPSHQRLKYLTLVINSVGGEVDSAFALIDVMKGSSIPIHTIGLGGIYSCGLLTFMAGEKGHRVVTPQTTIMSHRFSGGAYGKEHELFSRINSYEMTKDKIMNHYMKCTGLSESKVTKYLLPPEDVFLTAEEAVKRGLADSVVSSY